MIYDWNSATSTFSTVHNGSFYGAHTLTYEYVMVDLGGNSKEYGDRLAKYRDRLWEAVEAVVLR